MALEEIIAEYCQSMKSEMLHRSRHFQIKKQLKNYKKMRVEKQKTKQEEPKEKTVTLTVNDWNILTSSLMLLAECVGKLGIPANNVGTVYTNCIVLADKISKETK